jgi:UDP-glucose 4-epimerase
VRVLVTGHHGKIGRVVASALVDAGHKVVGFDIAAGDDVRDAASVRAAAQGCDAGIHLAAISHDGAGTPEEIMATNVLGTWHVLLAAREHGFERVVSFSSGQVFGIAGGERAPDYFPIDDDHPRYASRPYGLSKRLGEDLCNAFTVASGIATICLRPFAVWDSDDYVRLEQARAASPETEWHPFWEYGAFVDVRDVASAAVAALSCPNPGHVRASLCAADISASAPGRELAERLLPTVPWRGGLEYDADPWRALVDCTRARRVLGWRPEHRWSTRPNL